MPPIPAAAASDGPRPSALIALGLGIVVLVGVFVLATRRIEAERRHVVERRLRASVALLEDTAREVLAGRSPREGLAARMHDLGAATEVRITLILPNGEVLAESEVRVPMPNLADRSEVREAMSVGLATAARKSAMTGKESLYLAVAIEEAGVRLGTLRVATEAGEVQEVLGHLEFEIAAAVAAALALGAWGGFRLASRPVVVREPLSLASETPAARKAA